MTILTNGDSGAAAVESVVPEADIIAWDDVLFEGPVSGATDLDVVSRGRAAFLQSALGPEGGDRDVLAEFRSRDKRLRLAMSAAAAQGQRSTGGDIVLWFESDLFDQLQLAQIVAILGRHNTPAMIVPWQGSLLRGMAGLADAFADRAALQPSEYTIGAECWRAFCEPEPTRLAELVSAQSTNPDFRSSPVAAPLIAAFWRLLQEYPSVDSGLSRTQRHVLELLACEPLSAGPLFRQATAMEPDPFMGDWSFFRVVATLVGTSPAAIQQRTDAGKPTFAITRTGRALLNGECDFADIATLDAWIGGVHLTNQRHWRWDDSNRRLLAKIS